MTDWAKWFEQQERKRKKEKKAAAAKGAWGRILSPNPPPDKNDPFARAKAMSVDPTTPSGRIMALPEVDYTDGPDRTIDYMIPGRSRYWTTSKGVNVTGLKQIQSDALTAFEQELGGLGPIAVGGGKALIALLTGKALNADFTVVLTPARTVNQLRETYAEWGRHFQMPRLQIVSYSQLSRQSGSGLLTRLCDEYDRVAVVADEVHRLSALTSARTRRLLRFFDEVRERHGTVVERADRDKPDLMFVGLSGTLMHKSLKQVEHLSRLALRKKSPLPWEDAWLKSWCACMDVKGQPSPEDWNLVASLWAWAYPDTHIDRVRGQRKQDMIREAFQRRFRSAPGIVSTTKGSLGASLNIVKWDLDVPEKIQEAILNVDALGEDPAGNILPDDASSWRAKRSLSAGFYYIWDWPEGVVDLDWMDARKVWNSLVRGELEKGAREGYDSEGLVYNEIARQYEAGSRGYIHQAWARWAEERKKPQPPVKAIWIDDFLIQHAVKWAKKQKEPVILWYETQAVRDALEKAGMLTYGAGDTVPTKKGHTCAMSVRAQAEGLDLQYQWATNLIIEPQGGKTTEQFLGRTHRQGQVKDEVTVYLYQHTVPYKDALKNAIRDARFAESSTGNAQKLCYADYCEEKAP